MDAIQETVYAKTTLTLVQLLRVAGATDAAVVVNSMYWEEICRIDDYDWLA